MAYTLVLYTSTTRCCYNTVNYMLILGGWQEVPIGLPSAQRVPRAGDMKLTC